MQQQSALIARVGERVRAARKQKRYSRRELSERSGVSPRYLAQLEASEGNISIALLERIAVSLERPIEELVAPDEVPEDDIARLVSRFRQADRATRERALHILDPEGFREHRAERLCLIGLRGAGKSTLGALLAERLDAPFIELNEEIERDAGIPVGEIIALYGAEGYRTLEADTLKTIIDTHERVVLAVAGGVVEETETFANVLERCHTVWLQADPTEHMERVRAQGDLRPMADNPRAMEQLREILRTRESRYQRAGLHLNTSARSVETSLDELQALIASHEILGRTTV